MVNPISIVDTMSPPSPTGQKLMNSYRMNIKKKKKKSNIEPNTNVTVSRLPSTSQVTEEVPTAKLH